MKKVKLTLLSALVSAVTVLTPAQADEQQVDVLLIGGGIMSATLGTYLQELEPDWSMTMVERLDGVAQESSNGWNNAGTGHSALMELNYTPEMPDGSINVEKAVKVNENFQISRQFWSYQVANNVMHDPESFIRTVNHMSFVWGDKNVNFLRKRYAELQKNTLFQSMDYSEDPKQIAEWAPLLMDGRDPKQLVAATHSVIGTDVNYGEITRQLVAGLQTKANFDLQLKTEVRELHQNADKSWTITVADLANDEEEHTIKAKFVFIGAGGASLHLLQASGIPEGAAYGGFPVGGQFLITDNPEVVKQHVNKAYGQAEVGAPPMSVPHLDARRIDGKEVLLFGPFATFSTKFLKNGSLWDLLSSTTTDNVIPMMNVGLDNFNLVQYLIQQVMLDDDDRFAELQKYYPKANKADWKLWTAGQRVQIIKNDPEKGGRLQFGTEVVASKDASLAALLGASPGASTAAPIMLNVMEKVFADKVAGEWNAKLKQIIPSYGTKLNGNVAATERELNYTSEMLHLHKPQAPQNAAPAGDDAVTLPEQKAVANIEL
ncbi:malate dehydrogenase (quinone) [Shewanella avicenniae]|uniref:Probable malate:quinone oxidoreductase n=1 Tax=Shewanella avicenniae TaxID=2814294 RepID=A0ABX7QPY6_9GAMM|nr:malate dehydrogenase (quinone) [Shewanella avicenniae]QSX32940.1 malate dehydrogenase (quinone) [Shewanella avicenniae]